MRELVRHVHRMTGGIGDLLSSARHDQSSRTVRSNRSGMQSSSLATIYLPDYIDPDKVAVLAEIARSGSISAAGRALGLSYRRTWELVEELDRSLGTPVVETAGGGGGGTVLTQAGKAVIERYRAIGMDTALAARKHLLALHRACANK
ncbi:MAG TPA: LysR family transcriptional regulator [Acetobacteraceae bacterium]|nr:LysR family transcriptional regulator [Acetobacteraceae bacterium]